MQEVLGWMLEVLASRLSLNRSEREALVWIFRRANRKTGWRARVRQTEAAYMFSVDPRVMSRAFRGLLAKGAVEALDLDANGQPRAGREWLLQLPIDEADVIAWRESLRTARVLGMRRTDHVYPPAKPADHQRAAGVLHALPVLSIDEIIQQSKEARAAARTVPR